MPISLDPPTPDEVAFFNKTISNAKRLAADAALLVEKGRTKTAIMLAIFAIEELGKALIGFLGTRNKGNNRRLLSHVEKQAATFALLAGLEMTGMSKARPRRKQAKHGGDFHEMGPLSSQFAYARSGFFDDVRLSVTYADQAPKIDLDSLDEISRRFPPNCSGGSSGRESPSPTARLWSWRP